MACSSNLESGDAFYVVRSDELQECRHSLFYADVVITHAGAVYNRRAPDGAHCVPSAASTLARRTKVQKYREHYGDNLPQLRNLHYVYLSKTYLDSISGVRDAQQRFLATGPMPGRSPPGNA